MYVRYVQVSEEAEVLGLLLAGVRGSCEPRDMGDGAQILYEHFMLLTREPPLQPDMLALTLSFRQEDCKF